MWNKVERKSEELVNTHLERENRGLFEDIRLQIMRK
jgi:hypothetical protein